MAVELNHTIVHVGDSARAAAELAELLGLPAPAPFPGRSRCSSLQTG